MAAEPQPGRLISGRYRIVEKLGSGGFGRVWKARDETLHIDVAIKEVWLPQAMSPAEQADRLARAEREARNAARLRDHPGIVTVHDVVVEDGVPWTIMQLVSGSSLAEYLDGTGPLSVDQATRVAKGLLNALGAAHDAGIVHRDIKPANVMLASNGEVLLTDFGIAVHQADTALTATGALIGSVEYLAPERAKGNEGQAASDLFSLGVTLYQALEGSSPFRRGTSTGSLAAILFEQAPPPQRAGWLAPVIAGLLEKDPNRRMTVGQALALIEPSGAVTEQVLAVPPRRDGHGPAPTRIDLGASSPPKPAGRRRPAIVAVAALLGAALVIGLVAWLGPWHDAAPDATNHGASDTTTSETSPTTSTTDTSAVAGLQDPCDLVTTKLEERFALQTNQSHANDNDKRRRCDWWTTDEGKTPYYYFAGVQIYAIPYEPEPSAHPVQFEGVTGQEYVKQPDATGGSMYCFVQWPTSYGFVSVTMDIGTNKADREQLCKSTEQLANAIFPTVRR
ncbi:serine/threonine-protein kinase [Solihabitans fulvus]|uniref:serine/threonine-protein kinase n=1 Tax=Solihabitans fulvus TaxID=1892852 RepID=UPI00166197AD|nr:serine/threonine-protein kinase [Solihabitans fulvus]